MVVRARFGFECSEGSMMMIGDSNELWLSTTLPSLGWSLEELLDSFPVIFLCLVVPFCVISMYCLETIAGFLCELSFNPALLFYITKLHPLVSFGNYTTGSL